MSVRRLSGNQGLDRLHTRRQRSRRRALLTLGAFSIALVSAGFWGIWQPSVRIAQVSIIRASARAPAPLKEIAEAALTGAYLGIVPRNSTFFFPADAIRARVLAADPAIAGVSIVREGFASILVRIHERTPLARWCGSAPFAVGGTSETPLASTTPASECSVFDASGFIYARAGTTTPTLPFRLYAPLVNGATTTPALLADADALPAIFDFARAASAYGSPAATIVLRKDAGEVDDYLLSGTRITYVLGQEEDALTALASASANLNLTDGSLSYVDLRFPGKVYVK